MSSRSRTVTETVTDILAAHFTEPCDDVRCDPFSGRRRSAPMVEHMTELLATELACSHCPSMRTAIETTLSAHFPHGYACGDTCTYVLNSAGGWAKHTAPLIVETVAKTR